MVLEEEVMSVKQSEPFIAVTGRAGDENCQYFICAETAKIIECKSLRDAILDMICIYYVFNISYPKTLSGIFLLIQQYVFNIKDSQKPPQCLVKLLQNLQSTSV